MPKNRRNDSKTHSIALSGLLFALAMALSFIEGTLVIPGLLPGMKLGLANIVVMYALFFMGPKQALVLDILKALFVFLVSGWTAGFLSLCGGLLSLLVMWLLYYHFPVRPTWYILSVCGALAHNIGQLLGAGRARIVGQAFDSRQDFPQIGFGDRLQILKHRILEQDLISCHRSSAF